MATHPELTPPSIVAEPLSKLPPGAIALHDAWEIRESAIIGMDGARISSAVWEGKTAVPALETLAHRAHPTAV